MNPSLKQEVRDRINRGYKFMVVYRMGGIHHRRYAKDEDAAMATQQELAASYVFARIIDLYSLLGD